jgi:phosphopantothenoylcysteine decarboxylase/phosphopantothenate--cysteine ligase
MGENDKPSLAGYEILLCVTGGIACYKAADLASKLVQLGAGVTAAMTDSAGKFVTPLTFQTLTGRAVYTSMWQATEQYESGHLTLTEKADLMLIAPATANIIGKLANGIADDLISAMGLSCHGACEVLLAPAMNTRMWGAPAMVANVGTLKKWGFHVIGPAEGRLACRTIGLGRMAEPAEIVAAAAQLLSAHPPKGS